ncbi:hypothetical protein PROFUN_06889 [Planoprotostelium fungivorum]|uniref:EF-hand domain-containing protein n=1 Tax=Planoprotostelium fungivorum TaxID=1890364 RepID=A0A2P6NMU7_9EUKA|nr:hypothetical protein PROFUN_06889 [Planoprotostelium fungivorum]
MATTENIEECFNIFDARKQGYLEKEQLGTVLRALGKNPTEKELKEILEDVGSDKLDLNRVKTIYKTKKMSTPQDQDQPMRNAFKALDSNNNGKISEPELRQILGNLGDALSSQEVNALLREAKVDSNGGVDYNEFVSMLVSSYPAGDKLNDIPNIWHVSETSIAPFLIAYIRIGPSASNATVQTGGKFDCGGVSKETDTMGDNIDDLTMYAYTYLRTHPATLMAERTIIHIAAKLIDSAELTGITDWSEASWRWPDREPFLTILGRFLKGFGVGWSGKMVFALAGLAVKTRLRPGPLLIGLRRAAISREVLGYGMATGSFLASFEATIRVLKGSADRLGPSLRIWLASLVGSLSLLFIPRKSRQGVSIFFLVRALEVGLIAARDDSNRAQVSAKWGSQNKYIPSTRYGDVLLMAFASAQVIWAWLHFRPSLDPSYLKFLDLQGGRHIRPQMMMATFLEKGHEAVFAGLKALNKLNKQRMREGIRPLDRDLDMHRLQCALLHPQTQYCTVDGGLFFLRGLKRGIKVYLPIFLVPLVFRTNLLRRQPVKTLSGAFMGIARSSIFLSLYCTMCWSTACFLSKFGIRSHLIVAVAGFVGGLTVAIEKKGRRIELALYVLQQAIPSAFKLLRSKGLSPHVPNFSFVLFAFSLGAILNAYLLKEKLLRPSYVSLLDFLFDKSALIERSDSAPSPAGTPGQNRQTLYGLVFRFSWKGYQSLRAGSSNISVTDLSEQPAHPRVSRVERDNSNSIGCPTRQGRDREDNPSQQFL